MCKDKTSVHKISVDKISVNVITSDKLTVNEMSVHLIHRNGVSAAEIFMI
jgi:hypothetical protein